MEEEDHEKEIHTNEDNDIPAVVAELDDQTEKESYSRPRRANAGVGIERIQMDFNGKDYRAKRQFNFVTNGKVDKTLNHIDRTKAFMDVACNAIFAQVDDLTDPNRCNQMSVKAGFRKFGQEAVAAIVE